MRLKLTHIPKYEREAITHKFLRGETRRSLARCFEIPYALVCEVLTASGRVKKHQTHKRVEE